MIKVIAGYKFVNLMDITALKTELLAYCQAQSMKGTILLSHEGINLTLAGTEAAVQAFINYLTQKAEFADMTFKFSDSLEQPFKRMLIKLKKEIITMGVPDINPADHPAPALAPRDLKQWLDEGREVVIIDTRNQYEYDVGTFENAVNLQLDHFSEFPAAIQKLDPILKTKPVVVFCTGGIRCEKAAPYMQQQGFQNVYQLEGGILNYFEQCGGAHYQGDCFVFDERIAVDHALKVVPSESQIEG